jgi:hypothetical protein
LFTAIWFVLGCIQAAMMELHPDEAYYWQMSRFLDWGFFHQPPMVSAFIKLGYWIFENELGVRLATILASSIGILLLFKLSETRDHRTFTLIFLGFILSHVGVFMAVPDSPLIFFTLIFLVLLKEYLRSDKVLLALALGVVAAALMYSKYHAIVLFASVIIAAPKLLMRRTFWLTLIIGVALFVPHILWQLDHDLISFKFHWVIRDKAGWDLGLVWNYLSTQVILLGPLGILLMLVVFRSRDGSKFGRVLRFITIGFFGFFLFLSFRGRVEANWTATAFLPLIILGTNTIGSHARLLKPFRAISMVTIAILFVGRVYIASPWAGIGLNTSFPLTGWNDWAQAIKTKAQGRPVFFSNSYQYVSAYSFYSREQGYHWSMLDYNGNQFDLWNIDSAMTDKPIVAVFPFGFDSSLAVRSGTFPTFYVCPVPAYRSYRKLRFSFEQDVYQVSGATCELTGELFNGTGETVNLDSLLQERPLKVLYFTQLSGKNSEKVDCNGCKGILPPGASKPVSFRLRIPNGSDKCFVRFGLEFAFEMPEQNSDFVQLKVNRD